MILAFGTFVVGTDAYVIAGILSDIAMALHRNIGQVGQLVTGFPSRMLYWRRFSICFMASWSSKLVLSLALVILYWETWEPLWLESMVLIARFIAAAGAAINTPTVSVTAAMMHNDLVFSVLIFSDVLLGYMLMMLG